LSYDRARGEGVVVVADGARTTGTVEYIVLAATHERATALDARTGAALHRGAGAVTDAVEHLIAR
jgi:hypothetical protein